MTSLPKTNSQGKAVFAETNGDKEYLLSVLRAASARAKLISTTVDTIGIAFGKNPSPSQTRCSGLPTKTYCRYCNSARPANNSAPGARAMSLNEDPKIISLDRKRATDKVLASLDFPDITPTGSVRPTCANTRIAIGKLGDTCEYDVFHDKLLIGGKSSDSMPGVERSRVRLSASDDRPGTRVRSRSQSDARRRVCSYVWKTVLTPLLIISKVWRGMAWSASANG